MSEYKTLNPKLAPKETIFLNKNTGILCYKDSNGIVTPIANNDTLTSLSDTVDTLVDDIAIEAIISYAYGPGPLGGVSYKFIDELYNEKYLWKNTDTGYTFRWNSVAGYWELVDSGNNVQYYSDVIGSNRPALNNWYSIGDDSLSIVNWSFTAANPGNENPQGYFESVGAKIANNTFISKTVAVSAYEFYSIGTTPKEILPELDFVNTGKYYDIERITVRYNVGTTLYDFGAETFLVFFGNSPQGGVIHVGALAQYPLNGVGILNGLNGGYSYQEGSGDGGVFPNQVPGVGGFYFTTAGSTDPTVGDGDFVINIRYRVLSM